MPDLYARTWQSTPLGPGDYVISADEKTSIPAAAALPPSPPARPARSAQRVFRIVDNGSSHRGKRTADRLAAAFPNAVMAHTPIHASWLNQVEIYFSVVQRKVVSPNDFTDLVQVSDRLRTFEDRYNATAQPFQWNHTWTICWPGVTGTPPITRGLLVPPHRVINLPEGLTELTTDTPAVDRGLAGRVSQAMGCSSICFG